jgi:hypothetical protein
MNFFSKGCAPPYWLLIASVLFIIVPAPLHSPFSLPLTPLPLPLLLDDVRHVLISYATMCMTLPDASAPPTLSAAAETKMAAAINILFSPLLQGNIIGNCVFSLRYDIVSRGQDK